MTGIMSSSCMAVGKENLILKIIENLCYYTDNINITYISVYPVNEFLIYISPDNFRTAVCKEGSAPFPGQLRPLIQHAGTNLSISEG